MNGTISPVGQMRGTLTPVSALSGALTAAASLSGAISQASQIRGSLTPQGTLSGLLTIPVAVNVDVYEGPTEFTPTQQTQTISIQYKTAMQDITINPIPSNYGLITWNGSTLTVS